MVAFGLPLLPGCFDRGVGTELLVASASWILRVFQAELLSSRALARKV